MAGMIRAQQIFVKEVSKTVDCQKMPIDSELDLFRQSIYADVQKYWECKRSLLRTGDLKFGIFYSPVQYRPKLMIIGANPGFDSDDDTKDAPSVNLFFDASGRNPKEWKITPKLRTLFTVANKEETLRSSVVVNLLFFKSRCLGKHDKTRQGWRDNPDAGLCREIEAYCRGRVEDIVNKVDPVRILALGLGTWEKVVNKQMEVASTLSGSRRRIAVSGTAFEREALGMIHPTGARISKAEFGQLGAVLREFLSPKQQGRSNFHD